MNTCMESTPVLHTREHGSSSVVGCNIKFRRVLTLFCVHQKVTTQVIALYKTQS